MTDPIDPRPDDVKGRLEQYFAAEVSRAERDVRRAWTARPVPTERRLSRPRRTAALLATLAVAAILVLGSATLGAGWFARPTPSPSPVAAASSSTPASSPPSSPAPGSAAPVVDSSYPDGLPSSIGGEPVLRPADAIAHAMDTTDRTPFLVGGWVSEQSAAPVIPPQVCNGPCPSPAPPPLDLPTLGNEPGGRELWGRILGLERLHLASTKAVVVRVHVADPDSAGCAGVRVECVSAMVPESLVWVDGTLVPDTYSDGIPMAIDGQPVWRPGDVPSHLVSVVDDTPFLIGGTYAEYVYACSVQVSPAPPSTPLLPRCHGAVVADGAGIMAASVRVVPSSGASIPQGRPLVLRVHTHDPLSATCTALVKKACEVAIVIEAVVWSAPAPAPTPVVDARYPDGLPSSLDGQPVLRADAAHAHAEAATDASTFLVGGWSRGAVTYSCPLVRPDPTPEPMLPRCGDTVLDDVPLAGPTTASLTVIDPGSSLPLQPGLVVLRVHARDQRAEACTAEDLAACRAALVVDSIAWEGDATTATVPLTIQDVALRLQQVWPDLWLLAGSGDQLNARLAGCAVPAVIWRAEPEPPSMAPTVGMTILVYPTTERARSAPGLAPPASCPIVDGMVSTRLIQDNVVILVWGKVTPAELARIRAALKEDLRAPRY